MKDVALTHFERVEAEGLEELLHEHCAGDDDGGPVGMEAWEAATLFEGHRRQALALRADAVQREPVTVRAEALGVLAAEFERCECRDRPGHTDRSIYGGQRGNYQADVSGDGLHVLAEALGQPHRADVDAHPRRDGARLADDELGRAAAGIDHEGRSDAAVGRTAKGELGLLLAGEEPRDESVAPFDLAEEGLAVLGVAYCASRNEQHPFRAQPLRLAAVIREDVADARDRQRQETAPRVDALPEARDLEPLCDLLELAVIDVGDQEAGRVGALVDGCDTHLRRYASRMFLFKDKTEMVEPRDALAGRDDAMVVPEQHFVLGTPITPPFPDGFEQAVFGMGCFWGAERVFWQAPGVYTTAAGYAGGYTPNASYEEVCSGRTGHAEVVLAVYDPSKTSYDEVLRLFWENHDPTQGMRQGNDLGTQYRSTIYWADEAQRATAERSREAYQRELSAAGYGEITTEIAQAGPFYYAEPYHQQYLAKNPNGYCGLGGTGVTCPVGLVTTDS